MKNNSEFKKTIEHQFDSFCKTVLRNQARDIYDEIKRRNEKLVSIDALTQEELSQFAMFDTYDVDHHCFVLLDCDVRIEDILIAQAIESLSKKKQDIILLSFFLGLKNVEIASLMNLAESTVHYHKENALEELRIFMEEHINEEF